MTTLIGALLLLASAFFALTFVASLFILATMPSVDAAVAGVIALAIAVACFAAVAKLWKE